MRIKCRGYIGNLVHLIANEERLHVMLTGETIYEIAYYDIEIRSDDGAKIVLDCVKKSEIEVVNG